MYYPGSTLEWLCTEAMYLSRQFPPSFWTIFALLCSDVYQGSFFFQCVDGPGLLQAISSSRVKHSDDRGPQPLPRRTYSADLLALRDEDSVWQARKSLEQRPLCMVYHMVLTFDLC